jgi:hypothetical protein
MRELEFYMFRGKEYLGRVYVDLPGGIKKIEIREHPERLSERAKEWLEIFGWFREKRNIEAFYNTRIMPQERIGRQETLAMNGVSGKSNLEVFLAAHGMGVNDTVWISDRFEPENYPDKLGKMEGYYI